MAAFAPLQMLRPVAQPTLIYDSGAAIYSRRENA